MKKPLQMILAVLNGIMPESQYLGLSAEIQATRKAEIIDFIKEMMDHPANKDFLSLIDNADELVVRRLQYKGGTYENSLNINWETFECKCHKVRGSSKEETSTRLINNDESISGDNLLFAIRTLNLPSEPKYLTDDQIKKELNPSRRDGLWKWW